MVDRGQHNLEAFWKIFAILYFFKFANWSATAKDPKSADSLNDARSLPRNASGRGRFLMGPG